MLLWSSCLHCPSSVTVSSTHCLDTSGSKSICLKTQHEGWKERCSRKKEITNKKRTGRSILNVKLHYKPENTCLLMNSTLIKSILYISTLLIREQLQQVGWSSLSGSVLCLFCVELLSDGKGALAVCQPQHKQRKWTVAGGVVAARCTVSHDTAGLSTHWRLNCVHKHQSLAEMWRGRISDSHSPHSIHIISVSI